jgi:hypothetical protein
MPDKQTMQDWRALVREHLQSCGLPAIDREEVVSELATHLEESYEAALSQGLTEPEAVEQVLQQVQDWPALAEEIRRAKPQEDLMNHRTKTVWLPGIAILFLAGLLLMFAGSAPPLPQLPWIAGVAMLFAAAASESSRLSPRTRNFWLPGFVSMTAAGFFWLAADFVYDPSYSFTKISLHPLDLVRSHAGPARSFYFAWLVAQILFGALGAFFSRRAGGTRAARLAAGALPAIMLFGLGALAVPISFLIARMTGAQPVQAQLALGIFVWGVAPAITMLLGVAPFLREPTVQQRISAT